jgi:hypothetical protein
MTRTAQDMMRLIGLAVVALLLGSPLLPVRGSAQTLPASVPSSQTQGPLVEVPVISAEVPFDSVTLGYSDQDQAAMKAHELTAGGKPATGKEIGLWGWKERCQWTMPTPEAGQYTVSLFLVSGDKRPGKFGYIQGEKEHISPEFREKGQWTSCLKAFRIDVPAGQKQTRMFLFGDGVYFCRVDISRITGPARYASGQIDTLADSSYRTVIRRPGDDKSKPACVVLAPKEGVEAELARRFARDLDVPLASEPALKEPLSAFPAVEGATANTNLILLSAGVGGPLVQAMRRAELIGENHAIPGPGGYVIRTVPRPFASKANVIVISAGDKAGLEAGIKAFKPRLDEATKEFVYDTFLVDSPGER